METKNLLDDESSRMEAFHLLSACYFLPEPELSEKLDNLEGHMATVCEPALGFIQEMRTRFEAGSNMEALTVDFSKLFVGPYELFAAPYGSVYLDDQRKVMGDSTLDVKNRYREAGLDTAKNFKEAPDHIAAELEFMHYLIFKEIEAFANSDGQTAIDLIHKQKSFLEDHLMAWVPKFSAHIAEHAGTVFYQNLAKATETFIKRNYQVVNDFLEFVARSLHSEKDVEINTLRV